jgi:hypothetical protein
MSEENETVVKQYDLKMSKTFGRKTDPMMEGVDLEYIEKYEARIEDLKDKTILPKHYTVHSSIQLLPER